MEPARLMGFGLNQMEPEYVQPANVAEPAPLHHLGLKMMIPTWPSPPMQEVTPVTTKQMREVTPITPSEGQEVTSVTTKEGYGVTAVAAMSLPGWHPPPSETC